MWKKNERLPGQMSRLLIFSRSDSFYTVKIKMEVTGDPPTFRADQFPLTMTEIRNFVS